MKDNKKTIAIVLAVVICIVLLVVFLSDFREASNTPSTVVEKYLVAVQKDDSDAIAKYYLGNSTEDGIAEEESAIGAAVGDKLREFEFEILNEAIDGDKATVQVKLTTYKIGKAVIDALFDMSEATENGETKTYDECLKEEMEACEFGFESTVDITLTKTDNQWMIDEFEEKGEFMNALAGGLYSYLDQISSIFDVE